MHRVIVLTDAETATGYRLAGVEVRVADPEEAPSVLTELIEEDVFGLVIVDEGLIQDPVASAARVMRGRELPVLLAVPSLGAAFDEDDDVTAYMRDVVRSAIGFDVKME
ncbi:MAG: V-type ATP synthase subunit F [Trueperaceae bacterium]|nr:V-type ATP synthase subunit F [Trueperaceae bacterium]